MIQKTEYFIRPITGNYSDDGGDGNDGDHDEDDNDFHCRHHPLCTMQSTGEKKKNKNNTEEKNQKNGLWVIFLPTRKYDDDNDNIDEDGDEDGDEDEGGFCSSWYNIVQQCKTSGKSEKTGGK